MDVTDGKRLSINRGSIREKKLTLTKIDNDLTDDPSAKLLRQTTENPSGPT